MRGHGRHHLVSVAADEARQAFHVFAGVAAARAPIGRAQPTPCRLEAGGLMNSSGRPECFGGCCFWGLEVAGKVFSSARSAAEGLVPIIARKSGW
jgi:hypothetical protein